ncbi:MAG TPA: hypothetical protein VFC19_24805 [Candidatus Limnocylindrales bacterium]|nr:hypothetical protein [Candidatus Limnocylindrales bacterium]
MDYGWPDGTFLQGRDADRRTPVAVVVGRARVELATIGELAALPGSGDIKVVPEPLFLALPTRIADGTLVQGIVDPGGRVDLTRVALMAGGARAEFHDRGELVQCGYAGRPVWAIPSRVFRALPVVPDDCVFLRNAENLAVYRIRHGRRQKVSESSIPGPARVWSVPARVLENLAARRPRG